MIKESSHTAWARGRQSAFGSLLGNFGQRHVWFSGRRLPDDDLP